MCFLLLLVCLVSARLLQRLVMALHKHCGVFSLLQMRHFLPSTEDDLFLSLSRFHPDLLDDEAGAAPPVRPAEVGVALPPELHHQKLSDVHLRINQEGVGFVCGHLRQSEGDVLTLGHCAIQRNLKGLVELLVTLSPRKVNFDLVVEDFVGHLRASLQVHLAAPFGSDLVNLIAHVVASILSATQAEPFLKGFLRVAPVSLAGVFFVQQGVNEEMDGALMGAFHQLVHISQTPLCNHTNGFPNVASWLESASIWVNVNMSYWFLDPNTSAR